MKDINMQAQSNSVRTQSKRRSGRSRLKRIALVCLVVLEVLVVLTGGFAYWFVERTLPQTSGTLTVVGLQHAVTVRRDQWGVPHITASTLHDVIFAQGYITAQDRLFQMEMNRRITQGRLAEMFGAGDNNSLVDADIFLRTLGLHRAAEASLPNMDQQTRMELQSYADGINAFVSTHHNSLPLEFTILGISPAPWTSADSLAYGKEIALSLDSTWYYKYIRALILAKAGSTVANALFPAYPAENPVLIASSGNASPLSSAIPASGMNAAFAHLSSKLLQGVAVVHTLLGNMNAGLGSNNWVVDGTKTIGGKPLLANDPHLGIGMPGIWYEVALHAGDFNAIGYSFPGVPGIIIGHNDHIAWGVTNTGADDTDLYLEKLDPTNHPGQYFYNGTWSPLQTRQETIYVRDEEKPTIITVSSTIHGPLLNNAVDDLKHYTPVALKWTALQPEYTFAGFFRLNFATNWAEFVAALQAISISQNFIYADIDGNIGYRMSGLLPLRTPDNGWLPVDGSIPVHDWRGYVPQDQMPFLYNPPTHIITTANNSIVPANYPVFVSNYYDLGYRARRITDLLTAVPQLSIADFQRIQASAYSIPASQVVSYFIKAGAAAGGDAASAAKLLQGWDFNMTRDSVAASIYEVTVRTLLQETFEPILGKKLYNSYVENFIPSGLVRVFVQLVTQPSAPFFGITLESQAPTLRDQAIARAMRDSMNQLRATFGSDTTQWQWGKLHQAHFNHPLASVWPLNYIFGVPPVARPGDTTTINVGGDDSFASDPPGYNQQTVASMRQIIDLSNFDHSLWVITTGESGQPFSAHYSDLIAVWDQNHYQQMYFSAQSEANATKDTLMMEPR